MNKSELVIERRGPVQVITINDAPYNRMSLAFRDCLEDEVTSIATDDEIRAVVITGAGDENFSVGMNLKELWPIAELDATALHHKPGSWDRRQNST